MRPIRSSLILLFVLSCLAGVGLLLPNSRIIPNEIKDYLSGSSQQKQQVIVALDSIHVDDTLIEPLPSQRYDSIVINNELPSSFFDSLRRQKGVTRIIYYGDSQIEGDRITSFLRHHLTKMNGGSGMGMVLPDMPVMYTESAWIRASSNWKRYNYLSYRDSLISHKRFGPFMAICRYLPENEVADDVVKATVKIQPSVLSDSASSHYERLRILYNNTMGDVFVSVKESEEVLFHSQLSNDEGVQELSFPINGIRQVEIEFSGHTSPDIYAISIEGVDGVIVDNIPLRGSSGIEFTMVDRDKLTECYNILKPNLIILQYGLNIVKDVRVNYDYYYRGIKRQVDLLKAIVPAIPVIVVGVTDMAYIQNDTIITFNNITAINDAQRRAAEESGAIFWDAFQAMGGDSSALSWEERKLIRADFTHFTNAGADTLAKMMIDDLFSSELLDTIGNPVAVGVDADTTTAKTDVQSITAAVEEISPIRRVFSYDPDRPMIFTSYSFWLFFLVVLLGYSLFYKRITIRHLYLLLVSLFFYYKAGGLFFILLLIVTIIDFLCASWIERSTRKSAKKIALTIGIISNLLILFYFKYTSFIVESINDILNTDFVAYDYLAALSNSLIGTHFSVDEIILPIGISFFIFQSLSYMIDVYRGHVRHVKSIIDFGFYVSFFPQLVAGPIVRASEFIPQLESPFHLSKNEFSHAIFMVSKGLIKKIAISNFIATNFVDMVFETPALYSGFENLMAVYGYALQIYCDFSGYTDIAIGVALIMGFRLPINFNSPYKAVDLSDFWRRWHISLSRWLKDYLYIPLGGNRHGSIRTGLNLMTTMVIGGLWHGASLRFLLWGGLHGIGLIINKIWTYLFKKKRDYRIVRLIKALVTFNFVCFCWIFFRASSSDVAMQMIIQIFNDFSPGLYSEVIPYYSRIFLVIIIGYSIHLLPERVKESYRGSFIALPMVLQLLVVGLIVALLCQMRTSAAIPFIYFRF